MELFSRKTLITGFAIATLSLPGLASAQDAADNASLENDSYGYYDEDVIIVGAVKLPAETLEIDSEAEKKMTFIPEVSAASENQEDDLLQFALNGLTETSDKDVTDVIIAEE